jgi:hypothetical protein
MRYAQMAGAAAAMMVPFFVQAQAPTTNPSGDSSSSFFDRPLKLAMEPDAESVYAPPVPPSEEEGTNQGAVNLDLTVRYMTDYVYRGIDRAEPFPGSSFGGGHEDAPNLQFDGSVSFDLGKLPHPFVGAFVNVYDSDPISRFQEVRPFFGVEWTLRPLILEAGHQNYIFPERDELSTAEVYGKITFDDSWLFRTEQPILSPYIYGAYDYDLYNGWYFEAGISHDFAIEDTGIVLTAVADIAYVRGYQLFLLNPAVDDDDTGFQHYDLGLIGRYSLNTLFNIPKRYGDFSIEGYLYYTDNIDQQLRADTQIWGGMGIRFQY